MCADLNLWAINLLLWKIVDNYVTYNLWICVLVHFETNLFVLVVSIYIFGLIWFILRQNCLFVLFQNTFETPKQNETKFSLVSKMNRNKRETDPVLVIEPAVPGSNPASLQPGLLNPAYINYIFFHCKYLLTYIFT